MALFGKKEKCPAWFMWLVVVVGVLLALADIGLINLRNLGWGPVALILIGLGALLKKP